MFSMSYWRSRCPICPIRGLLSYIKYKYTDMSGMSDYLPSLWITPPLCPQLVHNCGYPVDNYIYRTSVLMSTYLFNPLSIVDLSTYRPTNPIPPRCPICPTLYLKTIHLPFTFRLPSVHLDRLLCGYQVERTGCSK